MICQPADHSMLKKNAVDKKLWTKQIDQKRGIMYYYIVIGLIRINGAWFMVSFLLKRNISCQGDRAEKLWPGSFFICIFLNRNLAFILRGFLMEYRKILERRV